MCTYLPSFTSAFSVNNTFCPLISLWITWWAWRCANPCIEEKRGRRGCSELGSWLSNRLLIPQRSQYCASTSCSWVQWDLQHTTQTAFGDGAETQASDHAHTVPKYSPTSALCKRLPAVLWRKLSSHKVSVQLHSKWHQCQCMPLTSDMHRVTQNLAGKGGGRRKEAASTYIFAPPRRRWGGRWQRHALLQNCSSLL